MAYLNGEQIPRALLDERLAALRAGDAACVLPRPDSREGRQLARWVAQVVVTEQICYDELHRRGIPAATHTSSTPTTSGNPSSTRTSSADAASTHPSSGSTSRGSASSTADTSSARAAFTRTAAADQVLDVSTAIAVGSITAAALAGSEAVRRVADLVSRDVRIPREQLEYAADVLGKDAPADPDVPVERWHRELVDSARLEAFARWLNAAQHERVRLVHGLEHPGDSNQPDNLHRH